MNLTNDTSARILHFKLFVEDKPDEQPLFHGVQEFQYTNRAFHVKLGTADMKQSISRVDRCLVNGPKVGFWNAGMGVLLQQPSGIAYLGILIPAEKLNQI